MTVFLNAPDPTLLNETFSRDHTPVATVATGESFTVHSLDAAGHLERQRHPGEVVPVALPTRRGHCLVGPIAVEGALAGQVLAVTLESLTPDPWGYTVAGTTCSMTDSASPKQMRPGCCGTSRQARRRTSTASQSGRLRFSG